MEELQVSLSTMKKLKQRVKEGVLMEKKGKW